MRHLPTYILSFVLYTCSVFAEPIDPNCGVAFESDPITQVEQCVNAMTGDCAISETDYVVPGAISIPIQRTYITGDSWRVLPHTILSLPAHVEKKSRSRKERISYPLAYLIERNGTFFTFQKEGKQNYSLTTPRGMSSTKNPRLERLDDYSFKMTLADGTKRVFRKAFSKDDNHLFLLYTEELPTGLLYIYAYDPEHRITEIITSDGEHSGKVYSWCKFRYHSKRSKGRDFDVITSDGATLSYRYEVVKIGKKEKRFSLKSVSGNRTAKKTYTYSSDGLLTQCTLPSGGRAKLEYDVDWRVRRLSTPDQAFEFSYHANRRKGEGFYKYSGNGKTTVKMSDGSKRAYSYGAELLPKKVEFIHKNGTHYKTVEMHWTKKGQLASWTLLDSNDSRVWTRSFKYDKWGNPIVETFFGDLSGNSSWESDTIHRSYDSLNRMVEETHGELAKTTRYLGSTPLPLSIFTSIDERIVRREFFTYDEDRRLMESLVDDGSSEDRNDQTDVSFSGTLPAEENPEADVPETPWSQIIDSFGNVVEEVAPPTLDESGNAIALVRRHVYDAQGNRVRSTAPNGDETYHRYNARSQKVETLYPDGTTEAWRYDLSGHCTSSISRTDLTTIYERDEWGRCVSKSVYDDRGTLLETEQNRFSTFFLEETWGKEHLTFSYDQFGYVERETLHLSSGDIETLYKHDAKGNLLSLTENGVTKVFHHDEDGRLEKIDTFNANKTLIRHEGFGYDDAGRLAWSVVASNHGFARETREYDDKDRLITLVSPGGAETRWTYREITNSLGQQVLQVVKESEDAVEITTYDALGRVVSIEGVDAVTIHHKVDGGQIIESERSEVVLGPHGNPIQVTNGQDLYLYTYDLDGNKICAINPDNTSVFYTYDALGRLVKVADDQGEVNYHLSYDDKGRLVEYVDTVANTRGIRSYDELGNLIEETLQNGLNMKSSYDLMGRCQSKQLPDGSSILYNWNHSALTSIQRVNPVWLLNYGHQIVDYDLSGFPTTQRLPHGLGSVIYDLNEDLEVANITYQGLEDHLLQLDPLEGPPHLKRERRLTYDALGRLTEVTQSDKRIVYTYDCLDRRLSKRVFDLKRGRWVESLHHVYLHDGDKDIGAFDMRDNLCVELRICTPTTINTGDQAMAYEFRGKTYIPLYSPEGNIAGLFSVLRNTLMEAYTYDKDGNHRIYDQWNVEIRRSKAKNPWRFGCMRFDEDAGIYLSEGFSNRTVALLPKRV